MIILISRHVGIKEGTKIAATFVPEALKLLKTSLEGKLIHIMHIFKILI